MSESTDHEHTITRSGAAWCDRCAAESTDPNREAPYTPSTARVRQVWEEFAEIKGSKKYPDELFAQFDRWLAGVVQKAQAEALRDYAEAADENPSCDGSNWQKEDWLADIEDWVVTAIEGGGSD